MEHRVATFLLVAATALLAIEANADSSRINSISNSISSSHGSSGSLSVEGVCVVDDSNGNEAGCSSDTSTVSYAVDPHELLPHEQNWPLNRGWDPSLDACDEGIDVRPALTIEEFRREFKGRRPVVFKASPPASAGNSQFAKSMQRHVLLERHASVPVTLSSSNSYSHGRRPSTLGNYMLNYMSPQHVDTLANETWYLFGDTINSQWDEVQAGYSQPLDAASDEGITSLGLGGRFSGVSFHTHGAAFAETLIGRKRWFLTPPGVTPSFEGDESQLQWLIRRFPTIEEAEQQPLVCTVGAGYVIYIPGQWHHATFNLDMYNAFISVFTQERV